MLQDGGRLRGRGRRERRLLPDVLLNSLQRRNALGNLFLLGSDLFYAAPHDREIERQGRKLLRRVRRSCTHDWRLRRRNG